MVAIAKIITLSLALIDVRVISLSGAPVSGQLRQLDETNISLTSVENETTNLPLGDILEVEFLESGAPAGDELESEAVLRDGSRIPLTNAEATAETATLETDGLGQLTIPRSDIRAFRLQPLKPEWQAQWNAFLERNNDKDLLIVAKRDESGLDFLSGVVSRIGIEDVPFLLDGDEIPVPRARVFGVVFPAEERRATPTETFAVKFADGTILNASTIQFADDEFRFESAWGQEIAVAASKLTKIDFSSGRLHYLSDLEPLTERYFGLDPPGKEWGTLFDEDAETRTGLSSQWRFSRDRFPNNGRPPLMLDRRVYAKGLCIFPSATLEYALDEKYSRFTAMVGVDDDVAFNQQPGRPPTAVELRIELDGKGTLRKLIKAPDKALAVDLNLTGVTTLTIVVDFGDGESTCDYLDLADAKLIVDTQQN